MYIDTEKRLVLDGVVEQLQRSLTDLQLDHDDDNIQGNIGYVILKVLQTVYPSGDYQRINDAIGLLQLVQTEYARTIVTPFLQQEQEENGTIDTQQTPTILNEVLVYDD